MRFKHSFLVALAFFAVNVAVAQSSIAYVVDNKKANVYHLFRNCNALKKTKQKIIVTNEKHCLENGLRLCKICKKSQNRCVPSIDNSVIVKSNNYPNNINIVPQINQKEPAKHFVPDNKKYKKVPQITESSLKQF